MSGRMVRTPISLCTWRNCVTWALE